MIHAAVCAKVLRLLSFRKLGPSPPRPVAPWHAEQFWENSVLPRPISVPVVAAAVATPTENAGGGLYVTLARRSKRKMIYVTNPVIDSASVFDTAHADAMLPETINPQNR